MQNKNVKNVSCNNAEILLHLPLSILLKTFCSHLCFLCNRNTNVLRKICLNVPRTINIRRAKIKMKPESQKTSMNDIAKLHIYSFCRDLPSRNTSLVTSSSLLWPLAWLPWSPWLPWLQSMCSAIFFISSVFLHNLVM